MIMADQITDEIYGLHCDIGRLENEKKHWHTEFINEQEYAHIMEERAEKTEAENAKLRKLVRYLYEYRQLYFKTGIYPTDHGVTEQRMRELGVEV